MILAFKYIPAEAHGTEEQWVLTAFTELDQITVPGTYAIYEPTQAKTDDGLPNSFSYKRKKNVKTA